MDYNTSMCDMDENCAIS